MRRARVIVCLIFSNEFPRSKSLQTNGDGPLLAEPNTHRRTAMDGSCMSETRGPERYGGRRRTAVTLPSTRRENAIHKSVVVCPDAFTSSYSRRAATFSCMFFSLYIGHVFRSCSGTMETGFNLYMTRTATARTMLALRYSNNRILFPRRVVGYSRFDVGGHDFGRTAFITRSAGLQRDSGPYEITESLR